MGIYSRVICFRWLEGKFRAMDTAGSDEASRARLFGLSRSGAAPDPPRPTPPTTILIDALVFALNHHRSDRFRGKLLAAIGESGLSARIRARDGRYATVQTEADRAARLGAAKNPRLAPLALTPAQRALVAATLPE